MRKEPYTQSISMDEGSKQTKGCHSRDMTAGKQDHGAHDEAACEQEHGAHAAAEGKQDHGAHDVTLCDHDLSVRNNAVAEGGHVRSSSEYQHDHGHHHHEHGRHDHHHHGLGGGHHHGPNNRTGLLIAFLVTASIMVLEFVGGLITNSLALLSDAGHMLSDASSLLLSLAAVWFAARPATRTKTYGFYRVEILAALLNGLTLFIVAGWIIAEAYERFLEPAAVASGTMMLIAAIGLLANLISAWVLLKKSDTEHNMNVRSAYLHILADALGSVGAIAAGAIMYWFEWYVADPLISVIVSLLIVRGAWRIVKQCIHILMEGTPSEINVASLQQVLERLEGVIDVHELHVWSISSGRNAVTCHLVIEEIADSQEVLRQARKLLSERFDAKHMTVQIEKSLNAHHAPNTSS